LNQYCAPRSPKNVFQQPARNVQRIWAAHELKPHLTKTFKLSNDPLFCEKNRDIVGLYLDPPDRALVLCVDEKSQILALGRTQGGLPMKKGRAGTHRHQEFLRFLRTIDRNVSERLDLHLVVDNYATHKHAKVKAWLKRHTRFRLRFTPTSASWTNLVKRFGLITEDAIRRGIFRSVGHLKLAIENYLEHHNADPKPFIWTAKAADILKKVARTGVLGLNFV
jgi:hypothetical protein